jgi:hypothetical protein
VCGQVNVINLFREEDKRAKNFVAIRAERKGNFARKRSHAMRANFRADLAIACSRSGSRCARSQFFASRRILVTWRTNAIEIFFALKKYF